MRCGLLLACFRNASYAGHYLHNLVQLPEGQVDLARHWLEDLREDAAAVESLRRGRAGVAEGRVKPLEQCERERRL